MKNKKYIQVSNNSEILNDISISLDISKLIKRFSFRSEIVPYIEEIPELVEKILALVTPKAVFKSTSINKYAEKYLEIDGVKFSNPLLQVNLKQADHIFPYVVTIGKTIDPAQIQSFNTNLSYVLISVQKMILDVTLEYLRKHLSKKFNIDILWSLQPGETEAWPEVERKQIFSILRDVENNLPVKLSDEGIFDPLNSACGIFYSAKMEFEGCQICPQEPCMGRRAPYSEELAAKFADMARKPCGAKISRLSR
jgi:hypothetical protein